MLVALGIDSAGDKHILELHEGSTEAARVVRKLLADLIERRFEASRIRLWVIDGGKALRRAIVGLFAATALIQRCQEHKRRNIIDHLPEGMHAGINRAARARPTLPRIRPLCARGTLTAAARSPS